MLLKKITFKFSWLFAFHIPIWKINKKLKALISQYSFTTELNANVFHFQLSCSKKAISLSWKKLKKTILLIFRYGRRKKIIVFYSAFVCLFFIFCFVSIINTVITMEEYKTLPSMPGLQRPVKESCQVNLERIFHPTHLISLACLSKNCVGLV